MKEAVRITWLILSFIVLLPIIIAVELWWLIICIISSKSLGQSIKMGVTHWAEWIKKGVDMNADFVKNGL